MNQKIEQTIVGAIIAMLVLTGLWALIYYEDPYKDGSMGELLPEELIGGEFNDFVLRLDSDEPARLFLNQSVFSPEAQGHYSSQYFDVKNGYLEFSAIVSPKVDKVKFILEQDDVVGWTEMSVLPGDDPLVDGQWVYDRELYITDDSNFYNGRYWGQGSPQMENFVADAPGWFQQAGMDEVYVHRDSATDPSYVNIIAKKHGANGSDTKEWIMVGGHMDLIPPVAPPFVGTWQGALDNTAGTSVIIALANAIGQWEPKKTIVLALWSGEEEGTWGSEAWVNDPDEVPADVDIQLYSNLDMPGLNWPGVNAGGRLAGYPADTPYFFRSYVGPDDNEDETDHPGSLALLHHTAHNFLDIPRNLTEIEFFEHPRASSDHANFWDIGVTTYKMSGIIQEYDEYHQLGDTLDHMVDLMGGVDVLVESFDYWLWLVYMNLRILDVSDDVHREGFGGS